MCADAYASEIQSIRRVCGASNFGCEQRVQELAQVPTNQAAAVSKGDRERSLLETRNPMGKLVGLGPCEGFGSPPGSWSWRPVRPCRARARALVLVFLFCVLPD